MVPPAVAIPEQVAHPDGFYVVLDGPFSPMVSAPVFLHARTAGGATRMVVVEFGNQMLGGKGHRVLCCRVVAPATCPYAR